MCSLVCRKKGDKVGREKERREKIKCRVSTITSNKSNLDKKNIISYSVINSGGIIIKAAQVSVVSFQLV